MTLQLEREYFKHYQDPEFQRVYRASRARLYGEVISVAKALRVQSLVDVGCSLGLLVEKANETGMDAWGLDLDIPELRQHHKSLERSQGKLVYGSIEDPEIRKKINDKHLDMAVILDTLRYLSCPKDLEELGVKYLLIKEVCDNRLMRHKRKTQWEKNLWSPLVLASELDSYEPVRIYGTRFSFKVDHPSSFTLKLLNIFTPTYTLVMRRRG